MARGSEGGDVRRVAELGGLLAGVALGRYGGGDGLRLAHGSGRTLSPADEDAAPLARLWDEAERACRAYLAEGGEEARAVGLGRDLAAPREREMQVATFGWGGEDGAPPSAANLFFQGWMFDGEHAFQKYPLVGAWPVWGAEVGQVDDGSALGLTASCGVRGVRFADEHVHTSDEADLLVEGAEGLSDEDRAALLEALRADRWQMGSDAARIRFSSSAAAAAEDFAVFWCICWDTDGARALLALVAVDLRRREFDAARFADFCTSHAPPTPEAKALCDLILRRFAPHRP